MPNKKGGKTTEHIKKKSKKNETELDEDDLNFINKQKEYQKQLKQAAEDLKNKKKK
tara:strand:+ start:1579 stop:1746 length:168 start_codon:yes stop_codon:yes gene_type:complete